MKQYTDIELTELTNDQIKNLFFKVRSKLIIEKDLSFDLTKNIEIYLCYIVRELENRNI